MDSTPTPSHRELYRCAFQFIRPQWRAAATGLIFMLASVGAGLLMPWPGQVIVDSVCGDRPLPGWLRSAVEPVTGESGVRLLILMCAVMLAVHLVQSGLNSLGTIVLVRGGLSMLNDLRCRCYEHLQRLSLVFHDRQSVGDSIYRVTGDTYSIQTLFNGGLIPLLHSIVMLAGISVILLRMDWTLTLLALCIVPLLFVSLRLFNKRIDTVSQLYHEKESSIYSVAQESLSAIRTVQAFAREEYEQRRFSLGAQQSLLANLKLTRLQLLSSFVIGLIIALGTSAMWGVSAARVLEGRITVGRIWVVIAYVGMLYGPISSISYLTTTVRGALARFRRVVEILKTTPQVADRPDAVPLSRCRGEVELDSVSFGYDPNRRVLDNVTLRASPGQLIALVGASGVGKSTLLSLLLRFYDPQQGRIRVDGRDIRDYEYRSLREAIAIVPQEPVLFSTSLRENIAYGKSHAADEEIAHAAKLAEAHDFIVQLPEGYDSLAGERGGRLSGGQRQRLALARAFLKNSPILVLDEPTTALDAETEASVLRSLERLRKNRTVIVVAHRLSTIRSATEIVVMQDGRVVERGRHEELLALGGAYKRLHDIQFAAPPNNG